MNHGQKNNHPGMMLARHFMREKGLSINRLARDLNVPPNRICAIVNGERSITVDTAYRLAHYFGTTAEFWLHLQIRYDLAAFPESDIENILENVIPFGQNNTPDIKDSAAE